jgi:hypothetical protein
MRNEQGQAAERGDVGGDQDLHDARPLPSLFDVDLHDTRMGVRAPVDRDVQHPGKRDVGDVPAAAREESGVLTAAHPGAEKPLAHPLSFPSP